jgi:hypothetical protein
MNVISAASESVTLTFAAAAGPAFRTVMVNSRGAPG